MFFEKLVGYLEAYRIKINPYGPCVANNMVGGKQVTVCWHIEDLKTKSGQTRGVKDDPMARVRIWGYARVMRKETRISGNVAGLLVTRELMDINGRISKGSTQ